MDTSVEATETLEAQGVESDPISNLPDSNDSGSFEAALEAAFSNFEDNSEVEEVYEEEAEEAEEFYEEEAEEVYEEEAEEFYEEEDEEPESELLEEEYDDSEEDGIESLTEDIGDDWTPKAASRFKELKTELKTSRTELEEMRQQSREYASKIEELQGLANREDVEQMQAKLAEYEHKQSLTHLEETPAFRQAITEPLADLVEQSDQIAEKYDIDADALIDAISLDDPEEQEREIAELLPDATDRDKARIFRIIEDVEPILQRREALSENAKEALNEARMLEERESQAEAAERGNLRRNVARTVVARVQEKLPFLKGIEGLDMAAIQEKASNVDPMVINPVDHAYNAVSAQLFPSIVRKYMETRSEIEALTDRLAEYEDVEPAMSGQTRASSVGGSGLSDNLSFEQRVNAALGSM